MKKIIRLLIALSISVGLATAVGYAAADGGVSVQGWPVVILCGIWAFLVNWLVFIPSNIAKTEHYYDLTGSLTYLSMVGLAVWLVPTLDARGKLVAVLVIIWALRLGTFLFRRISRDGKDDRFDQIKTHASRFFVAWTLQGLWVFLTAICALTIITDKQSEPLGLFAFIGAAIWVAGFAIEVIADTQKSAFKKNPENKGKFIQSGLWSWSRHPNYFGEMSLWFGVAIIAIPILNGWQWVSLISPVFVFVLINFISGVNKLEDKADEKWGDDPDYQRYKARTSKLVLRPPSK